MSDRAGTACVWMHRVLIRSAATAVLCLSVATLVAFIAAAVISKWYWGYAFSRPGIDPAAVDVERVTTFTVVETFEADEGVGMRRFDPSSPWLNYVPADPNAIAKILTAARSDPYYNTTERVSAELIQSGAIFLRLPDATDLEQIERFYEQLRRSDVLVDSASGYRGEDRLNGILIEAERPDGTRILIASLKSGQVANDHYVYYELVFEPGDPYELISMTRFNYDLAGMEGMEWRGITLMLCVFTWPIAAFLAVAIVVIAEYPRGKRRPAMEAAAIAATR